jgi:hypothetical protein
MILLRPTINLYYDNIVNGIPVPNGITRYKINKQYDIPVMSSLEYSDQVLKTTYFYNVMKANEVTVNLFTKRDMASNLFYPLELSKTAIRNRLIDIIPEKTLTRIKKRKMKLLLLYQQWIGDYNFMQNLKERIDVLIRNGVPTDQIYLITGDINCSYQELFDKVKVFGIDWWQIAYQLTCKSKYQNIDYHWVTFLLDDEVRESFDINNWNNPSLLFTALTGESSMHSLATITELESRELLDKGCYEFNVKKNKNLNLDSKIFTNESLLNNKQSKKDIINNLLSSETTIANISESLEDSLFAIVAEPFTPMMDKTYLSETNALWVSPNIWNAIAQGYPFMVVGSLSTMRYLNNEGYFSYVDLFNETYDSVSDLKIKLNLIMTEVDRLSKLSKEEINDRIILTKPFIEANKKKFYDKKHTWKFYDLFKEMQYE